MATTRKKSTKKTTNAIKANKTTHIVIALDRSGSMQSIREETIDCMNAQLKAIRDMAEEGHDVYTSIITFSDSLKWSVQNVLPGQLQKLTPSQYTPGGMTAMRDAIMASITHLKNQFTSENTGYLVCVISDGEDNSSGYTVNETRRKIEGLQEEGNWTFSFLLANQSIEHVSEQYSIPYGNMQSFVANSMGVRYASNVQSSSLDSYMVARSRGVTQTSSFYSPVTSDMTGGI